MRKELSIYNSIAGIINRLVNLSFMFIVRHYLSGTFSQQYLGLEGLFANILGLFSLLDLGLGNAIAFNLYEPLHNNDNKLISAIMSLYKKLYILMGGIVFGLSLMLCPFIPTLLKGTTISSENIRIYYLIYALGISVTYFFAYKRTLIFALQKNYKVLNVDTLSKIILSIVQIIILTRFHNYGAYLAVIVIVNLLGNMIISTILDREYKYDKNSDSRLPDAFKDKLKNHIKALAITNIAWQSISSSDNIIISAFVGVIDLAKNANYSAITIGLNSIFSAVLGGASASIGDLLVEKNDIKSKLYFDRYNFIYIITASYVSLGIYFVSDPVISLWVGEEYLFSKFTIFLVSLNMFLTLVFRPLADFQNYSGNFVYYKKYSVISLLINVSVSVVLGRMIGIDGVFIGTTATYLFMIVCVNSILNNHLFKDSIVIYYRKLVIALIPGVFSFILLSFIQIRIESLILNLICSFILVTCIYFISVIVFLHNKEEYQYFKKLINKIIANKTFKGL